MRDPDSDTRLASMTACVLASCKEEAISTQRGGRGEQWQECDEIKLCTQLCEIQKERNFSVVQQHLKTTQPSQWTSYASFTMTMGLSDKR